MVKVGILALQGDFAAHHKKLTELGAAPLFVKHAYEIDAVDALVFPGGESTTMLRALDADFRTAIVKGIRSGLPTLATCAGCILLAKKVTSPHQESLGLIDIDVERNAYGRQVDSFVAPVLNWTEQGQQTIRHTATPNNPPVLEGVFIRAPKILRTGPGVETLLTLDNGPVCVQEKNVVALTFHPELSVGTSLLHRYLLSLRT